MKKTNLPFKKKVQQLKKLIQSLSYDASEKTIRQIKRLFQTLSFQIPSFYLKRVVLGSTLAIALLSGYNIQAQSFKAAVRNPFGITDNNNLFQPEFFDIDGDGDLDLMTADYYGNHLLYRNTGTKYAPNFAASVTNPYGLSAPGTMITLYTSGDIDNDGDIDLIECGYSYGTGSGNINFSFIENTGTATAPAFAAPVNNPFALTAAPGFFGAPKLVDIDDDGDLDMVLNSFDYTAYSTTYYTYLNAGTASTPTFDPPITNPFGMTVEPVISVPTFADLDKDGDLDLFNISYYGNMTMYRDTSGASGDPSFTSAAEMDPFNIVFPDAALRIATFVDIDADNDLDLFASTEQDSTGAAGLWFLEDTTSHVGIAPRTENNLTFSVYPQPAINEITVECNLVADKKSLLSISDLQGNIIYTTELSSAKNTIQLGTLPAGMYAVQITNGKEKGIQKFIKQ